MTDSINEAGNRVDKLPVDEELYPQLMSLDRGAWDLVNRSYAEKLDAYFFHKRMLTHEDRQDAIQETFNRFFKSLTANHYDPSRGSLSQWMYSIARMLVREHKRNYASEYSRQLELSEEHADNAQSDGEKADEDVQLNPYQKQVSSAFAKLSDQDQEIIRIKINADDRTWGDIAQELKVSESAAKMRFTRALTKLKHLLS